MLVHPHIIGSRVEPVVAPFVEDEGRRDADLLREAEPALEARVPDTPLPLAGHPKVRAASFRPADVALDSIPEPPEILLPLLHRYFGELLLARVCLRGRDIHPVGTFRVADGTPSRGLNTRRDLLFGSR